MGGALTRMLGLSSSGAVTYSTVAREFDTTSATSGDVDFTTTDLGGLTPKAVLLVASSHLTANTGSETASFQMAFGVSDGTNHRSGTAWSEDASASSNDQKISYSGHALILRDGTNNSKRATASFITDGVRLTLNAGTSAAYRGQMAMFAGADLSVASGHIALGTGTSAITTTIGFAADLVIFFMNDSQFDGTVNTASALATFGACTSDGTQRSVNFIEADNIAAQRPFMNLSTTQVIEGTSSSTGAKAWGVTCGNFTATAFDCTPDASTGSSELGYLALGWSGRSAKIVGFDTATAAGVQSITGAGFTPSFAIIVGTNLEAVDAHPGATSDQQGGMSLSFVGNETWGTSGRLDSGADPMDTASRCDTFIIGASVTDCEALKGTGAFTSDGIDINWSAVQGVAKKWFAVFVS